MSKRITERIREKLNLVKEGRGRPNSQMVRGFRIQLQNSTSSEIWDLVGDLIMQYDAGMDPGSILESLSQGAREASA